MPLDKNIVIKPNGRRRPLILVTNDDGIDSQGIKALVSALKKIGTVVIVAPSVEQSAASHSFTLYRPLRCKPVSRNSYVVDGTPTDCVMLAVNYIFKDNMPDILISGINRGPNLGDDVHYSGTVSAAVEGSIVGIPSIAFSIDGSLTNVEKSHGNFRFKSAAIVAVKVVKEALKKKLPKDVILNVNIPNLPLSRIKGYKITSLGKKNYSNITTEKIDPRGQKYYWIHGKEAGFDDIPGSDCNAVAKRYVSITPLRADITEFSFMNEMQSWRL